MESCNFSFPISFFSIVLHFIYSLFSFYAVRRDSNFSFLHLLFLLSVAVESTNSVPLANTSFSSELHRLLRHSKWSAVFSSVIYAQLSWSSRRQWIGGHVSFGDARNVHDEANGRGHDTGVCAWRKRWWHWAGCGDLKLSWYFSDTDLMYALSFEEVGNEWHLGENVIHRFSSSENDCCPVLTDALAVRWAYDQFYPITN